MYDDLENIDQLNPGGDQTLLSHVSIGSITMAPGEGQISLSFLRDEFVDELSFPSIYCGKKREPKTKLTYMDIVKSAIRHYSRKDARVDFLFYLYKKKRVASLS